MNEFNYDTIQQYINGELIGEELKNFENELQQNEALANEVKLYATIEKEMTESFAKNEQQDELKQNLQKLNQQYFTSTTKAKTVGFWKYGLLAAAAAVLLFVFFNPFAKEKFDNEKLYAANTKQLYSFNATERGNNVDSLLLLASKAYTKNNFGEALPILLEVIKKDSTNAELKLVAAICYLQAENPDSAITMLENVINGKSVFINDALWYKSLALLKQNKLEECTAALKQITTDADKYKDAQLLLEKIADK